MHRRSLLSGLGGSLIVGLSGCVSNLPERFSGVVESRKLEETVEHRGVAVTPDAYLTADTVTYDIADSQATPSRTAPEGATHLLMHLTVEHIGENKRTFPSRGTFSGTISDRIKHFYKGERLSRGRHEDVSKAFKVNRHRFSNYIHVLLQNDMTSAVYAGSASGWLINIIPSGFTPSDATVKIAWGGSSTVSDEGSKTSSWSFTDSARLSPDEAASRSSY